MRCAGVVPKTPMEIPDLVLDFIIPATNFAVRRLLHGLHLSLLSNGVAQPDVEHTELVLAEVLNNIVEHAYADRQRGSITMSAHLLQHALAVELTDNGAPMPKNHLPVGEHISKPAIYDLPEGGFGLQMIRALTEKLDYERDGEHNRLTIQIPRTQGAMC